jgi:uncharacterized protein with HEPN domain
VKKGSTVYLRHIIDSIERLNGYLEGVDQEGFLGNDLLQAGVIREMEIIGEAAKQVDEDFRNAHAEIPWKKMAGMRDKLIHDYLGVDIAAVWDTVEKDLPDLKRRLNVIVVKK